MGPKKGTSCARRRIMATGDETPEELSRRREAVAALHHLSAYSASRLTDAGPAALPGVSDSEQEKDQEAFADWLGAKMLRERTGRRKKRRVERSAPRKKQLTKQTRVPSPHVPCYTERTEPLPPLWPPSPPSPGHTVAPHVPRCTERTELFPPTWPPSPPSPEHSVARGEDVAAAKEPEDAEPSDKLPATDRACAAAKQPDDAEPSDTLPPRDRLCADADPVTTPARECVLHRAYQPVPPGERQYPHKCSVLVECKHPNVAGYNDLVKSRQGHLMEEMDPITGVVYRLWHVKLDEGRNGKPATVSPCKDVTLSEIAHSPEGVVGSEGAGSGAPVFGALWRVTEDGRYAVPVTNRREDGQERPMQLALDGVSHKPLFMVESGDVCGGKGGEMAAHTGGVPSVFVVGSDPRSVFCQKMKEMGCQCGPQCF